MDFNNLLPGDLVFFSIAGNGKVDHDGIYIGTVSSSTIPVPKVSPFIFLAPIGNLFMLALNVYSNRSNQT